MFICLTLTQINIIFNHFIYLCRYISELPQPGAQAHELIIRNGPNSVSLIIKRYIPGSTTQGSSGSLDDVFLSKELYIRITMPLSHKDTIHFVFHRSPIRLRGMLC